MFEKLFNKKNKTSANDHDDDDLEYEHPYQPLPTTTQYRYSTSTRQMESSMSDDPFFKLKVHCLKYNDKLCIEKKAEMLELVKKCDKLERENGKKVDTCGEVISIYCYVFMTKDLFTCFMREYQEYIPGRKTIAPATPASTASTRKISINVITTRLPSTTSRAAITTTTQSTTRPTTRPTTRTGVIISSSSTTKPRTIATTPYDDAYGLINPFDGPVTSVNFSSLKLYWFFLFINAFLFLD